MTITKEQVMTATGSELDELVALAQGWYKSTDNCFWMSKQDQDDDILVVDYHPSTTGTQCMEIMEREKISVTFELDGCWSADNYNIEDNTLESVAMGETAMIAICRCFILSKLEVINGN